MKKVHRVTSFNKKSCLKPYVDMNIKLSKKAQNYFEKDFFKLLETTLGNVRKYRDIKLMAKIQIVSLNCLLFFIIVHIKVEVI